MPIKPMKTVDDSVRRWKNNASGATEEYKRGVDAVTENPASKAIAAKDKWFTNISEAHRLDKFARGLAGVTLTGWKDAAKTKGAANYRQGIIAGESKMKAAMTKLLPYISTVRAEIHAMPNDTKEDSAQRAYDYVIKMSNYPG
ncbi:MAG: hypothetical protein V3U19_03765 [Thermodesulfobacteriota bacterium]